VVDGDLLIAAVTYDSVAPSGATTLITVSDNYGNDFQLIDDIYDGVGAQGLRTFYAANAAGGPGDAFQATFSPEATWVAIYVAEYSGLDPANPLVTFQSGLASGAGPGMDAFGITVDVPSAPALLWGFSTDDGTGQPSGGYSAGTSFTSRGPSAGLWDYQGLFFGLPEDLAATDAGPLQATWSVGVAASFINTAAVFQMPDAGP
jgi:hypothetical protein